MVRAGEVDSGFLAVLFQARAQAQAQHQRLESLYTQILDAAGGPRVVRSDVCTVQNVMSDEIVT